MNPIELTSEQRSKLIKMTKALLKQDNVQMTDELGRYLPYQSPNSRDFICAFGDLGGIVFKFHWFEFVVIHLCSKLTNCQAMFTDIESDDIKLTIHPIDYLYEEFKKLEL